MSGQAYTITITTGLIDKLAGRQQPQKEQPAQAGNIPRRMVHPELLALKQQDAQLSRALASSQRVGNALLKAEEEETGKIKELAAELLQKYSTVMRPLPCQQERQACKECYESNPQDVLRCGPLVEAYSACAQQAYNTARASEPLLKTA